ncbi:ribbon-helix-helix domain-containing protein [Tardiphaga sp. 804_B3_N1_9]|uniref:ribbon-helix-helix domain-containing protein n=1 Tax=Tardiphaga TaxID=1395974 RepID=UPI001585F060|nr:aryl-sulfate sulfotransferase [Tardiphaga robiniae]
MVTYRFRVGGLNTSLSIEEPFWVALTDIADSRGKTANEVVLEIISAGLHPNRAAQVRLYVLDYFVRRHRAGTTARAGA